MLRLQRRNQCGGGRDLRRRALSVEVARSPGLQLCLYEVIGPLLQLKIALRERDLSFVVVQIEIIARDLREQLNTHRLACRFLGLENRSGLCRERLVAAKQVQLPARLNVTLRDVDCAVLRHVSLISSRGGAYRLHIRKQRGAGHGAVGARLLDAESRDRERPVVGDRFCNNLIQHGIAEMSPPLLIHFGRCGKHGGVLQRVPRRRRFDSRVLRCDGRRAGRQQQHRGERGDSLRLGRHGFAILVDC
jgi:hypothetical protein